MPSVRGLVSDAADTPSHPSYMPSEQPHNVYEMLAIFEFGLRLALVSAVPSNTDNTTGTILWYLYSPEDPTIHL